MPANLENSAMVTGLEKVSFHSILKEMQENNRMGNTRELFKKIGEIGELFIQGWTHKG